MLAGGTTTIASWGQGNVFKGTSGTRTFTQGNIPAPSKAGGLLDGNGRIVGRTHPQYATYAASQFVSVRDHGAVGDGVTDDTAAITNIFNTVCYGFVYLTGSILTSILQYSGCKIIFFDAGVYVVSSTITIPAGTQMVGEAWSVLAAKGAAFQNQNSPSVVFKVGATGSQGVLEITDILFTTIGPGQLRRNFSVITIITHYLCSRGSHSLGMECA